MRIRGGFTTGMGRAIRLGSKSRPGGGPGSLRRLRLPFAAAGVIVAVFVVTLLNPSNNGFPGGGRVGAFSENIGTFAASDCSTAKTEWNLGDTICAVATGASVGRRIAWIAPDGTIARVGPDFTGTGNDSYTLATGTDPLAQTGTWKVQSMDNAGSGFAIATFLVLKPNVSNVDLSILEFGPLQAVAGGSLVFKIQITNRGPDSAQNVVLAESIPNNTTFVSETQESGPAATCSNPGSSTCTIPSLDPNETAIFTFTYLVNAGTPVDTLISNSATVSSSTNELFQDNNTASFQTGVVSTPPAPSCTISCPSDIVTNNGGQNQCSVAVTYSTPTASGSCADPDTGQVAPVVCSPPSNSQFPIGTTAVVCATGGTACSFAVTVQDTRPAVQPTISCPANITAEESDPGSGFAVMNYSAPATTGNCVIAVCDPPSGSSFPLGTSQVTCVGRDSANTSVSCSFTVTVTIAGGAACTITCPGDITQAASGSQCSAVVTFADPSTTGSCTAVTCKDQANIVRHSGDTFAVGATTITCSTAEGAACDFTITVIPADVPAITTCASDKTLSVNSNCEATIPNLLSEVVATGCSVTLSQSPVAGSIVGPGPVTVIITAENAAGPATCSATVTVRDTTPPAVTCPGDITLSNDTGQCGAIVNYPAPTATDNCSAAVTIACSPASGAVFPIGASTVTCTATDDAQNNAACTFTVTINDTQAPQIICPSNISVGTDPNSVTATVNYQTNVSDNCPGATVVCSPASGSHFALGTTTVNCTATDGANNHASCSFTVTVSDNQPPAITCPASFTLNNAPNQCSAAATYPNPTVTDNQPNPTFTCAPASGSTFAVGVTIVTCTATDASGNHASCSFSVTVRDVQAPAISCPPNKTVANSAGQCSANVNVGTATATDNCAVASISGVRSDGLALTAPYPVGTRTITWTARDAAGNQTSCTQTVTVTVPQITAPVQARVWIGLKNSDDVGTKFDLLAEVLKNGAVVGSGQTNGVSGGSSGFNNAIQDTINLALSAPAALCPGDVVSFRLSVRVAANSSHTSGTARLWFNDNAANSRLSATLEGQTFSAYLLDNFVLGTNPGSGPKKTIDVLVNRNVGGNPFKPFGTWNKTF